MSLAEYFNNVEDFSSASLHEAADRIGALPSNIKPVAPSMRVFGPAFPVKCSPGNNIALHHAIYAAETGDVLVVDVGDGTEFGYWGEIMTVAAQSRDLAGIVIAGGVRDVTVLRESDFPVFSGAVCIRGTEKDMTNSSVGKDILIGDVRVRRGDVVFGDADGVVVLPRGGAEEIIESSKARDAAEIQYKEQLRQGATTLGIYNLEAMTEETPYNTGVLNDETTRRRSINVEGLGHGGLPIPAASRIENLVATGGVRGVDAATGLIPESIDDQIRLMFLNLKEILAAAGASVEDVIKLTIWICDPDDRKKINQEWLLAFPDPNSRPCRHILIYQLPGSMLVQCEALAVVGRELL